MRLRPTVTVVPAQGGGLAKRRLLTLLRFFVSSVGVAAVEHGYWSTLFRNILARLAASIVRGLRVRVDKIRVWKDGGVWEFKAEQFVLAGRAAGVFGSRYSLSVNELYINLCKRPAADAHIYAPVNASLVLKRGVEVIAFLRPRFFSLLGPRRMTLVDDLKVSASVFDLSCAAPRVFDAGIAKLSLQLSPGYTRAIAAKLPPLGPVSNRPRKPSMLGYWEGSAAVTTLALKFTAPIVSRGAVDFSYAADAVPLPLSIADSLRSSFSGAGSSQGSENGLFLRVESVKVDAYGKTGDMKHESMTRASINIAGCSAGSTAVDVLSHALYESMRTHEDQGKHASESDESIENINKIVAARPEALVWVEDLTAAVDVNCSKLHSARIDVAGHGGIMAIEPVGLVVLVQHLRNFVSMYTTKNPRILHLADKVETDSVASITRSSSGSSLQSSDCESCSTRLVCDLRHWTVMVLGHGPVGEGDTMAIVVSSKSIVVPQVDILSGSLSAIVGQMNDFKLLHWSQWARTTNLTCMHASFEIHRTFQGGKKLKFTDLAINWDLDMHSGLESLPSILATLNQLKHSKGHSSPMQISADETVVRAPKPQSRSGMETAHLTEAEQREQSERKHKRLLKSLSSWEISGQNMSITAEFPDGPKMGLTVAELPPFNLSAEIFTGRHVVLTLQDKKCAYGAEFWMDSPLHTMSMSVEKRKMEIEVKGFCFALAYDLQFGYLLQDWLLRLRCALKVTREAKLQKLGTSTGKTKRHPLPDIYFKFSDVEIYFEDHPLGGFLTRMLPLFQDETRERLVREQLMIDRIEKLRRIARAEIAGTAQRCLDQLKKSNSDIWLERVRKLKEKKPPKAIANGYLPPLEAIPVSTFVATSILFSITMDDLVREQGSIESVRRLKMLDDYELGSKKHNKTRQHDPDAWNSIGFRSVDLEAKGVRLRFRDYPTEFVVIDKMRFDKTIIGQAVQATLPPYVAETTVAVGRRRVVNVVKGLGLTKTYADIHLLINTLQCGFNPSFLGAISDFSKGVGQFFAGGRNPSPRIPWFDNLRVNMHGRMRITAKKLKGHLTSSVSPYSMTRHFVNIEADNFEMLSSRLEATEDDPFPICWKLHNWHIRPSQFDEKHQSEVVFDFVRVGMNPVLTVLSGDSQDHYFVPFPSKEQMAEGGPGIGAGTLTLLHVEEPIKAIGNGFGNYTTWKTGLHDISDHDSFKDFKTRTMLLGIDICVRHAESAGLHTKGLSDVTFETSNIQGLYLPPGASVVHSDAVTTLIKVIKKLIKRPISCKLSPRTTVKSRRPPSKTGLSSTLVGLDVCVDATNLNVMMFNNLEPGHGLFLSIASVRGELRKRTEITELECGRVNRVSRLTRRRFTIQDIYSSIRVPNLDMAIDSNDTGKLFTVDKISLSDDPEEELKYMVSPSRQGFGQTATSGFGSEDLSESPFYTFSANHPLQRGAKLDKVAYDRRLLVDRVRLIWSPVRRVSVFAWPDAFKEKVFCMKAPKVDYSGEALESENDGANVNVAANVLEASDDIALGNRLADSLVDDGQKMPELNLSEVCSPHVDGEENDRRSEAYSIRDSLGMKSITESNLSHGCPDPLSPPLVSVPRARAVDVRRPIGSMVDLLAPYLSNKTTLVNGKQSTEQTNNLKDQTSSALEVLKTTPKFALFINDCQVAFGSPETSGTVFLTSNAVRVGVVDKSIQKSLQFGEANERWSDREHRFHLDEANLYTRSKTFGEFDFSKKDWIPQHEKKPETMALVTRNPICMDLMYISSSSIPRGDGDEEEEDHILRPSLLFINIPDISMSTNAGEFHAVVDVVRKVLMQSMRSSEVVNEELANLRYKLQLAGGNVSSDELDEFIRRLNNVTRQFLYAGDTSQEELVEALKLPEEESFASTLMRYKAKAKAVATFTRQDQKAGSSGVLYPTMYISYSFDKCSWELREQQREVNKETEHPFVELSLDDLVCRHIFYVGRGSTTEMTFGNISAQNKIKSSYFQGILQPASTGTSRKKSRIKASDGAPVAFRCYSKQDHRVGGISVYELLTIQVAPMTAALTRKLWKSVSNFIFSARSRDDTCEADEESDQTRLGLQGASRSNVRWNVAGTTANASSDSKMSSGGEWSSGIRKSISAQMSTSSSVAKSAPTMATMDDVSQMAKRGESSMLFKYVFIDAFELTASFKNKENTARGVLDFFDLFVTTPSFSYSSQIWTWKAFSSQIRKDLVMTFARRGVSNLAKIKLLPGYSRARKRLARQRDKWWESLSNLVPTGGNVMEVESGSLERGLDGHVMEELVEVAENDDAVVEGVQEATAESERSCSDENVEENTEGMIDAAMADITRTNERRRETILRALYGEKWATEIGGSSRGGSSHEGGRSNRMQESKSSGESIAYHGIDMGISGVSRGFMRPPLEPSRSTSTGSRRSFDGNFDRERLGRPSLFGKLKKRAYELKEEIKAEIEEARRQ